MPFPVGIPRLLLALVFAVGLTTGLSVTAQVYKSTDDSGNTVYSDTPPASGGAERVEVEPFPPSSDVERAREDVDQVNRALDEAAEERRAAQAEQAAAKEAAERQAVACEAARSRLQQLESGPPNRRLVVEPDGSSRRVSWEEMQTLIEQARRQVRQDCGSE